MSEFHARLARALVFACLFPLSAAAFAAAAKPTMAGVPPHAAPAAGSHNDTIAVRMMR